jgi:HEAT repeat protein
LKVQNPNLMLGLLMSVLTASTLSSNVYSATPNKLSDARSTNLSAQTRWAAMHEALKEDLALVPEIKKDLKSKDWVLRTAAMSALNQFSTKDGQNAAKQLLSDKALVVRSSAVEILSTDFTLNRSLLWSEIHQKRNFRKGQSLWIRGQIAKKLSADPQVYEKSQFQKLLNDSDFSVREIASESLAKIAKLAP